MDRLSLTTLAASLGGIFDLGKSRLLTMAVLLTGIVSARTVNLTHIACLFPGKALNASNYRRLQRFFEQCDVSMIACSRQLMAFMAPRHQPVTLAMDRTNWKFGSKDINILVLAMITRRFRVPLMWVFLPHRGNSDTQQRIDLIETFIAHFGESRIGLLLADREFIGAKWLTFLNKRQIPFVIRAKENLKLTPSDGQTTQLKSIWHRRPGKRPTSGWLSGMEQRDDNKVQIAMKRMKSGEILYILTNLDNPDKALSQYRKRWAIECLFGDSKTRGFNLEDTHITDPKKLNTLMVVIALATAWACRSATASKGNAAIPKKSHGRPQKSWFRVGFDILRRWIVHDSDQAMRVWAKYETTIKS